MKNVLIKMCYSHGRDSEDCSLVVCYVIISLAIEAECSFEISFHPYQTTLNHFSE
jgi:hypothetical protein